MENVLTRISKFFIRRSVRGRKLPNKPKCSTYSTFSFYHYLFFFLTTGNILVYTELQTETLESSAADKDGNNFVNDMCLIWQQVTWPHSVDCHLQSCFLVGSIDVQWFFLSLPYSHVNYPNTQHQHVLLLFLSDPLNSSRFVFLYRTNSPYP